MHQNRSQRGRGVRLQPLQRQFEYRPRRVETAIDFLILGDLGEAIAGLQFRRRRGERYRMNVGERCAALSSERRARFGKFIIAQDGSGNGFACHQAHQEAVTDLVRVAEDVEDFRHRHAGRVRRRDQLGFSCQSDRRRRARLAGAARSAPENCRLICTK